MTRATKRRGQRATASEPADERPRFRVIADTVIRGSVWHAGKDFTGELSQRGMPSWLNALAMADYLQSTE
jgi:hypothetical protein